MGYKLEEEKGKRQEEESMKRERKREEENGKQAVIREKEAFVIERQRRQEVERMLELMLQGWVKSPRVRPTGDDDYKESPTPRPVPRPTPQPVTPSPTKEVNPIKEKVMDILDKAGVMRKAKMGIHEANIDRLIGSVIRPLGLDSEEDVRKISLKLCMHTAPHPSFKNKTWTQELDLKLVESWTPHAKKLAEFEAKPPGPIVPPSPPKLRKGFCKGCNGRHAPPVGDSCKRKKRKPRRSPPKPSPKPSQGLSIMDQIREEKKKRAERRKRKAEEGLKKSQEERRKQVSSDDSDGDGDDDDDSSDNKGSCS